MTKFADLFPMFVHFLMGTTWFDGLEKKKWNEFNLKADGVPNGSNAYGIELMNIKIIINIIIS